jgi:hypothetical protein
MSATWIWVRADLRHRWRSWIVLGLLAGITFGVAAAAIAGARRTEDSVPRFVAASHAPDAAVLANSATFDASQRARIAALPEVRRVYPFAVTIALDVARPRGLTGEILPIARGHDKPFVGVIVSGRAPRGDAADEVAVDENTERHFGLHIGSTMTLAQKISRADLAGAPAGLVPPGVDTNFRATLRVVGISKADSEADDWSPSSGFWRKYGSSLAAFVNEFVSLRHGEAADFVRFQADVQRITGRATNVERASDILGIRKDRNVTGVERDGLLLFALAAVLGGAVLVGQALVRAVTSGAGDLPAWRALGADRRIIVRGLVLPTAITAGVGGAVAVVVAIALSPRFPIGLARRYDLDLGVHADWLVLAPAALVLVGVTLATAWVAAEWRVARGEAASHRRSAVAEQATRFGLPPALLIGSRLAVERGGGRRSVPVRSALVGAVVGVLGVVACFTFRAGIDDAVRSPRRSGVVWNYELASGSGPVTRTVLHSIASDDAVDAALHATWNRAVVINRVPTPTFGTAPVKRTMPFVVLSGRAPHGSHEIAFAPTTLDALGVGVGDTVKVGPSHVAARVVGTALLPATSHTDYDQSAWMTAAGLRTALAGGPEVAPEDLEDYVLIRWTPGTDSTASRRNLASFTHSGEVFVIPATLPTSVADLAKLRTLPLVLAVFFALLAGATVAHALVTTVRRRRHDLAVLRTLGFTRRQSRLAIAWQATLLAVAGIVVGVPLGIAAGRLLWRWLADNFPIAYVPPLALLAVLVAIPIAVAVANALAAGPAFAASRIRPAEVLRTE